MQIRKKDQWQKLRDVIHEADLIIEVADARNIEGTRIPILEKWAGVMRLLIVANKIDLLPNSETIVLPKRAVKISAKLASERERRNLIEIIVSRARINRRPVRALMIGYPNVGKSTLANMLAHRNVAKVSNIAGTTRHIQWVRVNDDLVLSDYRGMFPKSEERDSLVKKGAINIQRDPEAYANKIAARILKNGRLLKWLEKKFDASLAQAEKPEDVLAAIAERRKYYLKGGLLNLQEAARQLLRAIMDAPERI